MYRLIATDLDGTLLNSEKHVSSETIEVLTKLNQQGVILLPSTGRTHRELPAAVASLPFLRYALTVNGGGIYDFEKGCYLYEVTIDNEIGCAVLQRCKDLPLHPSVIVDGRRMMAGLEDGTVDPYIQKVAAKGILPNATGYADLYQTLKENGGNPQKMLLYPDDASYRDEIMETLKKEFPMLAISTSGKLFIEVNSFGVDKGVALKKLCAMLNVAIEDTIAFGDAENDIALLDVAGKAVVMANGTDETKKHADEICDDCDHDGLRKTLEKYYQL